MIHGSKILSYKVERVEHVKYTYSKIYLAKVLQKMQKHHNTALETGRYIIFSFKINN